MSVQAGIWNFDGKPADKNLLAKLSEALAHCGPDGEKLHLDGSVGMLYRPFHTTPESWRESQPHTSTQGTLITWDGRLDNTEELILQLRGEVTSDQSDVSIVSAAFDRWGIDCFHKLIGDWAIVVWNPVDKSLVFARDYVGIRNLCYLATDKCVIWCTYLAPIVSLPGVSFTLNAEYIFGYLAHSSEAHVTPYREIHAVPPGKLVRIQNGKITTHSYPTFDPHRQVRYSTDAEYEEHFRHVFRQAVRRRLRSDSPILAELSGGLDSSSIVCMADEITASGEVSPSPRVDTVSNYNFAEPDRDDGLYFTKVEEKRGRKGHHIDAGKYRPSLCLDHSLFSSVPGLIWNKELAADRRAVVERNGYRVTLSGIGGDEFLGGIPDPSPLLADLIVQLQIREFAKQLMAWGLVKKQPLIHLCLKSLRSLLPFNVRAMFDLKAGMNGRTKSSLLNRYHMAKLKLGPSEKFGFRLPSSQEFARGVSLMGRHRTSAQPLFDLPVEYRYPYLDQDLLNYLISIPATQLLRPGSRRSLMRRALARLLPPEILSRTTKGTGSLFYMTAVNNSWGELQRILDSPLCATLGYIDPGTLREALLALKNGTSTDVAKSLRLVYLEIWLRIAVERGIFSDLPSGRSASGNHFVFDPGLHSVPTPRGD